MTSKDFEINPEYEGERDFLVQTYLKKPWSATYIFDPVTSQYEVLVPELNIGTCAASREEASYALEGCLATYFGAMFDNGHLNDLPEPLVRQAADHD